MLSPMALPSYLLPQHHLQPPHADPPAGGAIAIVRGDGGDAPAPPAQPERVDRGLQMPSVTPQRWGAHARAFRLAELSGRWSLA